MVLFRRTCSLLFTLALRLTVTVTVTSRHPLPQNKGCTFRQAGTISPIATTSGTYATAVRQQHIKHMSQQPSSKNPQRTNRALNNCSISAHSPAPHLHSRYAVSASGRRKMTVRTPGEISSVHWPVRVWQWHRPCDDEPATTRTLAESQHGVYILTCSLLSTSSPALLKHHTWSLNPDPGRSQRHLGQRGGGRPATWRTDRWRSLGQALGEVTT